MKYPRWCVLVAACLVLLSARPHAQTAVTLRLQWDPNSALDEVIGYRVYVDALPVVAVPTTLTAACACIESPLTVAPGPHVVKVTAVNLMLSLDPASTQEGPPLTLTFTLSAPVTISKIRILK